MSIANESIDMTGQEAEFRKEIAFTMLDFDKNNSSYIEEEDKTYIYNTTREEESSSDNEDDEIDADEEDVVAVLDSSKSYDDTDLEEDLITPKSTIGLSINKRKGEEERGGEEEAGKEEEGEAEIEKTGNNTASKTVALEKKSTSQSAFRKFLIKHEIPRKAFHSSIGVLTLWLYTQSYTSQQIYIPLITAFVLVFINDYVRLHNPEINEFVCSKMWFVIRESEKNSYNGVLYYLAGAFLVLYFCPKDIAVVSILLLSWADTAASTVGRQWGKYTPKIVDGKSVAGSLASFATGIAVSYLFYGYFVPQYSWVNKAGDIYWSRELSQLSMPLFSVIVGVIASISEFVNPWGLDDNFTIPVLSGAGIYLLAYLTHI